MGKWNLHTKHATTASPEKEAAQEATRRHTRTPEEDTALYSKLVIAFSVIQLALAMILFGWINFPRKALPVVVILAAICLLLVIKAWDNSRAWRVTTRVLLYLLAALPLLFTLVMVVAGMVMDWEWLKGLNGWSEIEEQFVRQNALIVCMFAQLPVMFALPGFAVASTKGHRFDVVSMRVFAIVELVLALFTCLYLGGTQQVAMGSYLYSVVWTIDNMYVNAFFCLCVAVTTVTSFVLYAKPRRFKKQKGLYSKVSG